MSSLFSYLGLLISKTLNCDGKLFFFFTAHSEKNSGPSMSQMILCVFFLFFFFYSISTSLRATGQVTVVTVKAVVSLVTPVLEEVMIIPIILFLYQLVWLTSPCQLQPNYSWKTLNEKTNVAESFSNHVGVKLHNVMFSPVTKPWLDAERDSWHRHSNNNTILLYYVDVFMVLSIIWCSMHNQSGTNSTSYPTHWVPYGSANINLGSFDQLPKSI